MSRGGIKITRADGDYEYASSSAAPRWLEEFAAKMDEKPTTAVEVARQRNSESASFIDRINAIMGDNNAHRASPYNSVEEAVKDYQKRTGLLDYHKKAMAEEIVAAGLIAEGNNDMAEADDDFKKKTEPELLNRYPSLEMDVRKLIGDYHGNIQLPALVEDILTAYTRRGMRPSDIDSEFYHWLNDILKEQLADQHGNNDYAGGIGIGTDPSLFQVQDGNKDPFINLMPARMANKK